MRNLCPSWYCWTITPIKHRICPGIMEILVQQHLESQSFPAPDVGYNLMYSIQFNTGGQHWHLGNATHLHILYSNEKWNNILTWSCYGHVSFILFCSFLCILPHALLLINISPSYKLDNNIKFALLRAKSKSSALSKNTVTSDILNTQTWSLSRALDKNCLKENLDQN